jgi:hypothetical protein
MDKIFDVAMHRCVIIHPIEASYASIKFKENIHTQLSKGEASICTETFPCTFNVDPNHIYPIAGVVLSNISSTVHMILFIA